MIRLFFCSNLAVLLWLMGLLGRSFCDSAAEGDLAKVPTADLVKLPRSREVYQALLLRENILSQYRLEALAGLAKLNNTTVALEAIAVIETIDKGAGPAVVLSDLAHVLAEQKPADLAVGRARLEKIAASGQSSLGREIAYVALLTADGDLDRVWTAAAKSASSLRDFCQALPLLPDAKLRASAFPKIKTLLQGLPPSLSPQKDKTDMVRIAAMNAAATMTGKEEEVIRTLAEFIRQNDLRAAAIRAVRRIPRYKWPEAEVKPLIDVLVAHLSQLPAGGRTEPAALDALVLGNDLASLLPTTQAQEVRSKLGKLGVQVALVRTLPHKLLFDRSEIYIEAGQPAVIVLENLDIAPHNLLIGRPGALNEIGAAAEQMANEPQALARHFVPNHPKVLFAMRLLQPREAERLQIVAPKEPGDYIFVCTYPGHWRVMNGLVKVVPSLANVPADKLFPPTIDPAAGDHRPFVRNWNYDDLLPEVDKIASGRNFERGQAMFKAATCQQCHKIGKEGGLVGPDLNEIPQKLAAKKFSRADLLREVIEPSKVINEKFKTYTFITSKGEVIPGVIVEQTDKMVRVVSNPLAKPIELRPEDIEIKTDAKNSLMPNGLLVTLNLDEVLDLLAFVAAGGDPHHPAFRRKE